MYDDLIVDDGLHTHNNMVSDGHMIIHLSYNLQRPKNGRVQFRIMQITLPSICEIQL